MDLDAWCGFFADDCVLEMPRGAQVIYPKDLAVILFWADVYPGCRVLEAGTGSGALTLALLRAVGPEGRVITYEQRDEFARRALANIHMRVGEVQNLVMRLGPVEDGVADEEPVDRVVLDLPEPWKLTRQMAQVLRPGGILLSYLPTIIQSHQLTEALNREASFTLVETFETLMRPWNIDGQSVRPFHRMVAHTGFLTVARRVVPEDKGGVPPRLGRELHARATFDESRHARLELDPRERRADAHVDAAAEADVLCGVRPPDVEHVGLREDARVAIGGSEQQRDLLAPRDRDAGDLDTILEHPALEELERRVEAEELLDRHGGRHRAVDQTLPLVAVVHQRPDTVSERVHGRLVAGVQEDDDGRHDLGIGEMLAVDTRLDERRHEIVAGREPPLADQLDHVVAEGGGRGIRPHRLLFGRIELVHLHHRVRPVEEVAMPVAGHPEPPADEGDRVRLGEVVEEIHVAALDERVEELAGEPCSGLAHRLDAPRRESRGDELADPRVLGWLDPEQAPALDIPERLPARVEGRLVELVVCSGMAVVAAQPPIPEARPDVGVAGDEPAVQPLVAKDGRRLAQLREHGIRVCEEGGRGRVELGHGYSREPTYSSSP